MHFEIKVVEQDGERLFSLQEGEQTLLFSKLSARWDLVGGNIVLRRQGDFIETGTVRMNTFRGYNFLYEGFNGLTDEKITIENLIAEKFETGDELFIYMQTKAENGINNRSLNQSIVDEFKSHRLEKEIRSREGEYKSDTGFDETEYRKISAEICEQPLPAVLRFQ
jgi:hypothetical protein